MAACHMWQQRPARGRRACMAALWGQSAVLSMRLFLTKVHQCLGLDGAVKLHALYCELLHCNWDVLEEHAQALQVWQVQPNQLQRRERLAAMQLQDRPARRLPQVLAMAQPELLEL